MKNKEFMIVLTCICFIMGLMITMQLKTVKKNTENTTVRTSELQAQYSELKKDYDAMIETLDEKEKIIQDYRKAETSDETAEIIEQELANALKNAGLTDVRGQGITIVMNDSTADFGPDVDINQNPRTGYTPRLSCKSA